MSSKQQFRSRHSERCTFVTDFDTDFDIDFETDFDTAFETGFEAVVLRDADIESDLATE